MEKLDIILSKLEEMESRLNLIEGRTNNQISTDLNEIKSGEMMFAGKYESPDGKMKAEFSANNFAISKLLETNSFEMARVIDAFSSEERINIVKMLIQKCSTAKQIMNELNFSTTGKLYHHLSFLEKIGVVRKDGDDYHVSARYINCILLIFAGVESIIYKNNNK